MIVSVVASVLGAMISAVLAIYILASFDIGFTFVREGTIKFVKKGESVFKVYANVRGWKLDDKQKLVELGKDEQPKISFLTKLLGVYGPFIPIIHSVHHYEFIWPEWETKDGEKRIRERGPENTTVVYHLFTYPARFMEADCKDGLHVDITGQFTIRVIDPVHATFTLNAKWLPMVFAAIEGAINDYCGGLTFKELREKNDKGKADSAFVARILEVNEDTAGPTDGKGLRTLAGVEIVNFDFSSAALSTRDSAAEEATKAVEVAELLSKATKTKAGANAYAITTEGTAYADVLKKKRDALGSNDFVLAEAIREAKPSTLVIGAASIVSIPTSTKGEKTS